VSFAEIDENTLTNIGEITIDQIWLTVKLRDGNVVEFSEDYLEFGQSCVGGGGLIDVDWDALDFHRRKVVGDVKSVFYERWRHCG
jgi:hypothetical protein